MKNLICIAAFFAFIGCASDFEFNPAPLPAKIDAGNFSAFPVSLNGYSCRIIKISNYTGTIDTNGGWWRDAVVYQVFVRSFKDSGSDGKGDLNGLISKLDYITNTGFNAIWTLPVFNSPSTHGYDTIDYRAIEPDYGTMGDFDNYISQSHARGVKVILDMVINHTSGQNTWFTQSAANNVTYQDWYVWQNPMPPGWQYPWGGGSSPDVWKWNSTRGAYYYAAFWDQMPDLNYDTPAVKAEIKDIAYFWIAKGVDGFRLDAARYIIESGPYPQQADTSGTKAWWREYRTALNSSNANFMTVGEVWTSENIVASYYDSGLGLDMAFDFDFYYRLTEAIQSENASGFKNFINTHNNYAPWAFFAPFLDNHDNVIDNDRTMDVMEGSGKKAKLAAAMLMTSPGTPFVYYGTEIGMKKGSQGGDLAKRTPMQWTSGANAGFTPGSPWTSIAGNTSIYSVSVQEPDTNSILNYYKWLIGIRKSEPAFARGQHISIDTGTDLAMAFICPGTNYTILVVANFSSVPLNVHLNFTGSGLVNGTSYPVMEYLMK
ncbi:MAG: alpha-amylase [Brevinematales bacterium]|nr:alpha-amylase [Brevinematales bacterium]